MLRNDTKNGLDAAAVIDMIFTKSCSAVASHTCASLDIFWPERRREGVQLLQYIVRRLLRYEMTTLLSAQTTNGRKNAASLQPPEPTTLVLCGNPGCGKSSTLARISPTLGSLQRNLDDYMNSTICHSNAVHCDDGGDRSEGVDVHQLRNLKEIVRFIGNVDVECFNCSGASSVEVYTAALLALYRATRSGSNLHKVKETKQRDRNAGDVNEPLMNPASFHRKRPGQLLDMLREAFTDLAATQINHFVALLQQAKQSPSSVPERKDSTKMTSKSSPTKKGKTMSSCCSEVDFQPPNRTSVLVYDEADFAQLSGSRALHQVVKLLVTHEKHIYSAMMNATSTAARLMRGRKPTAASVQTHCLNDATLPRYIAVPGLILIFVANQKTLKMFSPYSKSYVAAPASNDLVLAEYLIFEPYSSQQLIEIGQKQQQAGIDITMTSAALSLAANNAANYYMGDARKMISLYKQAVACAIQQDMQRRAEISQQQSEQIPVGSNKSTDTTQPATITKKRSRNQENEDEDHHHRLLSTPGTQPKAGVQLQSPSCNMAHMLDDPQSSGRVSADSSEITSLSKSLLSSFKAVVSPDASLSTSATKNRLKRIGVIVNRDAHQPSQMPSQTKPKLTVTGAHIRSAQFDYGAANSSNVSAIRSLTRGTLFALCTVVSAERLAEQTRANGELGGHTAQDLRMLYRRLSAAHGLTPQWNFESLLCSLHDVGLVTTDGTRYSLAAHPDEIQKALSAEGHWYRVADSMCYGEN